VNWGELFPLTDSDISVTLSPQQVSLLAGLLFYANNPSFWGDFNQFGDEIDATISSSMVSILGG